MEQKTHTGLDSLQQLPLLLKELKVRRIFLVTGNKSFEVCGAKEILYVILKDYHIHRFSDFTPNPKIEDIQKGIEEFEINKSDIILAVGGGSVMDVAKSIALLSRQEKPEQGPLYVKGEKPLTQDPLRVIAIPTTAGSGSEATHFAVVYVEGKKYSLAHKLLRPAHVFLVPEFGLSLDKKTAASAAMDALCQAIESYWSIGATEESKGYSAKAIRLLLNNLPQGIIQEDLQNKAAIMEGAYLAGRAINIAKTTGAHALSYFFTSHYNIPHGQAVALSLPGFIIFNSTLTEEQNNDPRGLEYVLKTMEDLYVLMGVSSAVEAAEKIFFLLNQFELQKSLSELGLVKENIIRELVKEINWERLSNNPRKVDNSDIKSIF